MHRKMSHYIAAFFLILFLFFGTVSVFANDAQCSLHIIKSEEGYFERFGYVNDDGIITCVTDKCFATVIKMH